MARPRYRLALVVFAALGLAGCGAMSRDHDGNGAGIGLVHASDQTRASIGVVGWDVTTPGGSTLVVTGIGESHEDVVVITMSTDGEVLTVATEGASTGQIVIRGEDGEILENTLSDTVALQAFYDDGQSQGFREVSSA